MNQVQEFDMNKPIIKPKWYLIPIQLIIGGVYTAIGKTKFYKHGFKNYNEPSLIFINHASMFDFSNVFLDAFPRRICWPCSIEEFLGREWLFRNIGCYPKRKFTTDVTFVKKTADLIRKQNTSVGIFPEARFSIGGIKEDIGTSVGKMAKLCKCRVIVVNQKGNFLKSPQWAKHPYRKNPIICDSTLVCTKEEVMSLSADEIQARVEKAMQYDEYKWAFENKIEHKCKENATNIHKILYKCPTCGKEGRMNSKGLDIWCEECNSKWHMGKYSELECVTGETKFQLVSDWYRWEREECYKEVNEGTYHFEDDVRVERLVNSKIKFVDIGTVHMTHDQNGFALKGTLNDGSDFELIKHPTSTRSVHIEYDFKGRGDALDMNTVDTTWFVFPKNPCCLTKFNFATEAIFEKAEKEKATKLN